MGARFDQHFLKDIAAVKRICDQVDLDSRSAESEANTPPTSPSPPLVLEIGPGQGVLTREMLSRGWQVYAIERDSLLMHPLQTQFAKEIASEKLTLVQGDILKTSLDAVSFEYVVSNLPYSISSQITFFLLEHRFREAVLMYQKEFADRMLAPIGSRECGRLTVMVQTFAYVTHCFDLPRHAFSPPPAVTSTVLKLQPKDPVFYIADRGVYAAVVRELFSKRRKMVRTILALGNLFAKEKVALALSELDSEILDSRPEKLYLEDYATISNLLT
jgi:16S rRNA (adenine1518-N6/adenine1519-N6)-dimethyltransferase